MAALDEGARQYRRTLAHAVRLGLTEDAAKVVIGRVLVTDVACGRVTDWHGVCDRLTAAAREAVISRG